jgi:hypothetical protein
VPPALPDCAQAVATNPTLTKAPSHTIFSTALLALLRTLPPSLPPSLAALFRKPGTRAIDPNKLNSGVQKLRSRPLTPSGAAGSAPTARPMRLPFR